MTARRSGKRAAVTVVIPTRDRLDLVRRSVRSALAQQDVGVTVVLVDDGSRPETAEALDGLAGARVRVVHHAESRGVSRARNAGLALAETPWVAFMDDDDYWAPDKLSSQLRAVSGVPGAGWSCVGAVHVDDDVRPLHWHRPPTAEEAVAVLSRSGGIPGGGSGVLVATALAREVGAFDPEFAVLADWDFYYRLALAADVAPVDRPLVGYYRHGDSMFHDPGALGEELVALDDKYRGGAAPLELSYADWAVQLLLMAWRRRDAGVLRQVLGLEVVRRAGTSEVAQSVLRRLGRGVRADRRECPPSWQEEQLGWLDCAA